ncbi:hypothetical protein KOI40_13130 [Aestuariicella sp. G3-2]|uniref:hypothetical protein n=1 Tax=Pseudomaricurvus albidus TaxID=2842452 RepID=UPI001C0B6241|nr:hypothetical protein [Aestuariicella albida]MBU3070768.1 hypothetical protein [Aestuariicella albida]
MKKYLLTLLMLLPLQSHALLITTSIGDYEVSTITGSFNTYITELENTAWMNNETLALEFSTAVTPLLGDPGPFFLFKSLTQKVLSPTGQIQEHQFLNWIQDGVSDFYSCIAGDCFSRQYTYAVASEVISDVDGTVPLPSSLMLLLGGLLGLRLTRQHQGK